MGGMLLRPLLCGTRPSAAKGGFLAGIGPSILLVLPGRLTPAEFENGEYDANQHQGEDGDRNNQQ